MNGRGQYSDGNDTPGVLAPPPVINWIFFLAGPWLQSFWPVAGLPGAVHYLAGGAMIAVSFVLAGLGLRVFVLARTSVKVYRSSPALIAEGQF